MQDNAYKYNHKRKLDLIVNGNGSLFQVTKGPLRFIHLLDSTHGAGIGTGAGEMRLWGGQSPRG